MNTRTAPRLGFVGLGHMGGNMAAKLLAAGYQVYGQAEPNSTHGTSLIGACAGVIARASCVWPPI